MKESNNWQGIGITIGKQDEKEQTHDHASLLIGSIYSE